MRPLDAKPPEAVGYPVRDMLTPDEQIAFDKFVAERKSDPHMAIDGKTPDQVRQMLRNQLEWVAEENAKVAENAKWQGDLMDPKMDHPPAKVPSAEGDVWVRYNKVGMTTKEIEEAGRLSSRMGMRVDLFGDNFPGIDGVASSGSTRIPVQLKGLTGAESAADAARVAKAAFDKAGAAGFTGVEVYIEAPHLSIAEVRAEFGKLARAEVIDGKVVMRVRVLCKDGVYEPALPDPIKAPHPGPDVKDPDRDKDKDRVPVGVGG